MGVIETYVSISAYQDYDTAAYKLGKEEAAEVIGALQRQIPKRPIGISVGKATSSGLCPSCENDVVFLESDNPKARVNFCRICGQKINWNTGE